MDYQKLAEQYRAEAVDLRNRAKIVSGYSLRDAEYYDQLAAQRDSDAAYCEAEAKKESAK